MKMTNIKIDTYDVSDEKDGFMIDIVTTDEDYESWIYHKEYADKQLMYGCARESQSYEEFVDLVKMGDIKGYIDFYLHSVLD